MMDFSTRKCVASFPTELPSSFMILAKLFMVIQFFIIMRMIQACCLKKLLEVIRGQPHLMFEITLSGSHELLVRQVD
jgi:hypothetical protein